MTGVRESYMNLIGINGFLKWLLVLEMEWNWHSVKKTVEASLWGYAEALCYFLVTSFKWVFPCFVREDEFVIFELKYVPCSLSILYKGYRVVESRNIAMDSGFILSILKTLLCFHALLFITWFLYLFDWHKQVWFVGK